MKDLYNISEIARLFHLHPDTLRYYEERGLLHPVRGENRYRMYTIQDICTLNIIRSLRDLDMPVERIGEYLKRRSVESTLALIREEEALLTDRMAELEVLRTQAEERRHRLGRYTAVPVGEPEWIDLPPRPFVALREDIILEHQVDFLLKKLETEHQDYIRIMGSQCMGATLDQDSLVQGIHNHYANVFFLTDLSRPHDGLLPGGRYARLYYRGPYTNLGKNLNKLEAFIRAHGGLPAAPPLELYHIDVHDTHLESEFLTEVQWRME